MNIVHMVQSAFL